MKEKDLNRYTKILDMLLELSDKGNQEYAMGCYITREIRHGMFHKILYSSILIIASQDALKKIDEWALVDENRESSFFPRGFQYIFTTLIKDGHSLVIWTNHSDWYQLLPEEMEIPKEVSKTKFETDFLDFPTPDVYCYTYDDDLGKAVQKIVQYRKPQRKQHLDEMAKVMIGSEEDAIFINQKRGERYMLSDGTFVIAGDTLEESRRRLDDRIDDAIYNKPVAFVKKLIRRVKNK